MADTKTTALSAFTPVLTDLLYGVDDPGGVPASGKLTLTSVRDLFMGGSDTQVQFNDGGAFGGDAGFTFDKTNKTVTLGGGTVDTSSKPILDLSQTWNDAGVTFTGLTLDVTDTASASGSKLIESKVGGVPKLTVTKSGVLSVGVDVVNDNWIEITEKSITQKRNGGGFNPLTIESSNTGTGVLIGRGDPTKINSDGVRVPADQSFSWSNNTATGDSTVDLELARDATNTLALRNGTNAQIFNIYNTFTDASNYERGGFKWNTNILEVFSEAAGTGTARPMSLTPADIRMPNLPTADPTVAGQLWNNSGVVTVSSG